MLIAPFKHLQLLKWVSVITEPFFLIHPLALDKTIHFNRDAYVGPTLARQEVIFFETLEGLEARVDGQGVAVLRYYRTYTQKAVGFYSKNSIPTVLRFEPLPHSRQAKGYARSYN